MVSKHVLLPSVSPQGTWSEAEEKILVTGEVVLLLCDGDGELVKHGTEEIVASIRIAGRKMLPFQEIILNGVYINSEVGRKPVDRGDEDRIVKQLSWETWTLIERRSNRFTCCRPSKKICSHRLSLVKRPDHF
jgi:hypothetical protein